jgi:hypothetical protein
MTLPRTTAHVLRRPAPATRGDIEQGLAGAHPVIYFGIQLARGALSMEAMPAADTAAYPGGYDARARFETPLPKKH